MSNNGHTTIIGTVLPVQYLTEFSNLPDVVEQICECFVCVCVLGIDVILAHSYFELFIVY